MSRGAYEQLMEVIQSRRSVRRFTDEPVAQELLERLVEAARWAPSAGNRQAFRILVVTGPEIREAVARAVQDGVSSLRAGLGPEHAELSETYLDAFTHFTAAPLLLAFIHRVPPDLLGAAREGGLTRSRRAEDDALASCAAAITHLLLAAQTLGLGACWMTGPLQVAEGLDELLRVPRGWRLAALVPVGHPAESPAPPARRERDELVRHVS